MSKRVAFSPVSDSVSSSLTLSHNTDSVGEEISPAWENRRATARASKAARVRAVSGRRRLVDPTTCDRDYSAAELEFLQAIEAYKKRSGRSFPTWSEVLEVVRELGYERSGMERVSAR